MINKNFNNALSQRVSGDIVQIKTNYLDGVDTDSQQYTGGCLCPSNAGGTQNCCIN